MTATLSRRDRPRESYTREDRATRRWVAKGWTADSPLTRSQLLTFAQNRIAELTGPEAPGRSLGWEPVHSVVASFAMTLLDMVVTGDDLATPQVAPTPDGGLEIQWLVSGDSLAIAIDLEDCVSIVARRDSGDHAFEPFDWDFDDDIETLIPAVVAAGRFLEKISTGIQHRLPVR
jgi:hypothetical protein